MPVVEINEHGLKALAVVKSSIVENATQGKTRNEEITGSNNSRADFRIAQQRTNHAGKAISRWEATPFQLKLEYEKHTSVTIPSKNWIPNFATCEVRLLPPNPLHKPRQDWLPLFTRFAIDAAHNRLRKGGFGKTSIRKVRSYYELAPAYVSDSPK
jgi:hypothetical protein